MSGPALALLLPGAIGERTGGTLYDRHMVEGLRARGWRVQVNELDDSFPSPSAAALGAARACLARIADDACVVIDGLALGAMPDLALEQAGRLRLVGLVHHPLALETGLAHDQVLRLTDSERRALAATRHVIVTSPHTARTLARYGVTRERITVVRPGTPPAAAAVGSTDGQLNLLCVASLTPRKGHAVLFQALHALCARPWRVQCVGSDTRDPATAAALRDQLERLGLTSRITLCGELRGHELERYYHQADLFVLASHYEGYGMVLDEALARGLPIVATRAGAIPDTVPAGAGMLVPAGDALALAGALGRLMADAALRVRMAVAARNAAAALPSWEQASGRFAVTLQAVIAA